MGWLRPAAIRSRREAERDLFRAGRYPTGTIPVWAVDRNGRVDFSRPIRRLTETEALALLRPASTRVPPTVPLPVPTQPSAAPSWWQRLMDSLKGKATS
jgi:lysozyme